VRQCFVELCNTITRQLIELESGAVELQTEPKQF